MRIYFVTDSGQSGKLRSRWLRQVQRHLIEEGTEAEIGNLDAGFINNLGQPSHDLYILTDGGHFSLSMAGVLYGKGARILNPYPSCLAVDDRLVAAARMKENGLQLLPVYSTQDPRVADIEPAEMDLRLSPARASTPGAGRRIKSRGELQKICRLRKPMVLEERPAEVMFHWRLNVVGGRVWTQWRPAGGRWKNAGLSYELCEWAHRVGQALGMFLYSVELVEWPMGLAISEVSLFPSHYGVPSKAVAEFVHKHASRFAVLRHPTATPELQQSQDEERQESHHPRLPMAIWL